MTTSPPSPPTSLRRSADRVIAGVCGGLAEYFQVDAVLIRLAFVALAFTGAGILLYLVLWILMPPAGPQPLVGQEAVRANLQSLGTEVRQLGEELRAGFRNGFRGGFSGPSPSATSPPSAQATDAPPPPDPIHARARQRSLWLGLILVGVGIWLALQNLGYLRWWSWSIFWPVVLIAVGVLMLQRIRR